MLLIALIILSVLGLLTSIGLLLLLIFLHHGGED